MTVIGGWPRGTDEMADPSYASEPADGTAVTPGVAEDWASDRTRNVFRLLALFILPSIFLVLVALGGFLFLTQHKAATPAQPVVATAPAATPSPVSKDAEIAALQNQIALLQAQLPNHAAAPAAVAPAPTPLYAADAAALAQISARLDRIEANQRAIAHAAAAANAAEALQRAAASGAPFTTELAVVQSSISDPHVLDTVRPFADKGIPSEAELATQFPHAAAIANIAAKGAKGDNGVLSKISHWFGNFISVRRTDSELGTGTEATLAHAERRINAGDLAGAVAYLDALPTPAQTAMGSWLDAARARTALDAATLQISEQALTALGNVQNAPVAGGGL